MTLPAILDPCCGSRMMWFDRCNPAALFGDSRSETLVVPDRSHGKADGKRVDLRLSTATDIRTAMEKLRSEANPPPHPEQPPSPESPAC